MKFINNILKITLFILFLPICATSNNLVDFNNFDSQQGMVPNVVVLKFNQDLQFENEITATGDASFDNLISKYQVYSIQRMVYATNKKAYGGYNPLHNVYFVSYSGDTSPAMVAQAFTHNPLIEYAEPKFIHYTEAVPNDPSFILQENFYNVIQALNAWDLIKGEEGDVVLAVVDGGTDIYHPDLANNIWINEKEVAGNGIDDDGNGFTDDINGWNFANNTPDPSGLNTTPSNANHGSHTGGLMSAISDNSIGVAGASWNANLLAVNSSSATSDNIILHGFDGILYAAENGADVINCSWGRLGSASQYEQGVIDYAVSLGTVVVASAGNNGVLGDAHFPSAYDGVLSVTATDNNDVRASFSNYGKNVDVSAPGVVIYSTFDEAGYGNLSGTSMASPIAAGIVGLIKTQNPDWLGVQAAEQLRVTTDNIDDINPAYAGRLGKGRINAYRALTEMSPSIRISEVDFSDSGGDGVIDPGETIEVFITLINYLTTASDVNLELGFFEFNSNVTLGNVNATVSSINTMEEVTLSIPFTFDVAVDAPSGNPIEFALNINSTNYEDVDYFKLTILPNFGTSNVNNIAVTVTNIGRIGFPDAANPSQGIGFSYQGGPNLLFEGAIIAGTSADQISNAARNASAGYDEDFSVASGGDLQIKNPGIVSDEESIGIFEDSEAGSPMNILVTQQTYAMLDPAYDDIIIFKYSIENLQQTTLNDFHFGIFFDWDIDGGSYDTNIADYDSDLKLGYTYDSESGPSTHVAMSLLTAGPVSYRAIYNDGDVDPNKPALGLYDGFTDAEKWETISGGATITEAGPADVSSVIASGPFDIESNTTIEIGFALLGAPDLGDLTSNAIAAQDLWEEIVLTGVESPFSVKQPATYALEQNYPNPFNPVTEINFQLPKTADAKLEIFNMLGQKVRTLVQGQKSSGFYKVFWDGRSDDGDMVAAGIYVYRLTADAFIQTRKMLLIK